MGSITLAGRQIFILNENDRYPEPQQIALLCSRFAKTKRASTGFMFGIKGAGRSSQKRHLKQRAKPLIRRSHSTLPRYTNSRVPSRHGTYSPLW